MLIERGFVLGGVLGSVSEGGSALSRVDNTTRLSEARRCTLNMVKILRDCLNSVGGVAGRSTYITVDGLLTRVGGSSVGELEGGRIPASPGVEVCGAMVSCVSDGGEGTGRAVRLLGELPTSILGGAVGGAVSVRGRVGNGGRNSVVIGRRGRWLRRCRFPEGVPL